MFRGESAATRKVLQREPPTGRGDENPSRVVLKGEVPVVPTGEEVFQCLVSVGFGSAGDTACGVKKETESEADARSSCSPSLEFRLMLHPEYPSRFEDSCRY